MNIYLGLIQRIYNYTAECNAKFSNYCKNAKIYSNTFNNTELLLQFYSDELNALYWQ